MNITWTDLNRQTQELIGAMDAGRLTKREQFAAQFMAALIANGKYQKVGEERTLNFGELAEAAVRLADVLVMTLKE